jgi:hypothetical protein
MVVALYLRGQHARFSYIWDGLAFENQLHAIEVSLANGGPVVDGCSVTFFLCISQENRWLL